MQLLLWLVTIATVITVAYSESCKKLASFNAALLHRVGDYVNREPRIAEKLAQNDADFYCLQEVWLESDIERMVEKIRHKYPHHYSPIHYKIGQLRKIQNLWQKFANGISPDSPCSIQDKFGLPVVGFCAQKYDCFNIAKKYGIDKGAKCLTTNCGDTIKSWVQAECFECIALMFSGLDGVMEACAPDLGETRNRLNPSGLTILSKKPISNIKYTKFWPDNIQLIERGYIEAEIDGVKKIVCTHMSSTAYEYVEYDMNFPSFEAQHKAEIEQLKQQFGKTDHILMGDLNTGPNVVGQNDDVQNLEGEASQNYDLLIESGYKTSYHTEDGRCTYCKEHPLTHGNNQVIDHILVKGEHVTINQIKRIMDDTQPVLSDHYGVEATVCPAENKNS